MYGERLGVSGASEHTGLLSRDHTHSDASLLFSTTSTVQCHGCSSLTSSISADASTVTLALRELTFGLPCVGADTRETLPWRHVRLVSSSVGARDVCVLLRSVLAIAVLGVLAWLLRVPPVLYVTCVVLALLLAVVWWIIDRAGTFGAFSWRGDNLSGPLALGGLPTTPADARGAMRAAMKLWSAARDAVDAGADGSGDAEVGSARAAPSSAVRIASCGVTVGGDEYAVHPRSALAVLTRRRGCFDLGCTASTSGDALFLRDARWVGSESGSEVYAGSPLGFVVAMWGSLLVSFGVYYVLFFIFFFNYDSNNGDVFEACNVALALLLLVAAAFVRGNALPATLAAMVVVDSVTIIRGVQDTATAVFLIVTAVLAVVGVGVRLFLGQRSTLMIGVLEGHAPSVRVPRASVDALLDATASAAGMADGAPAGSAGRASADVYGEMSDGSRVFLNVTPTTTTVLTRAGFGCCTTLSSFIVRTRDIQFVHTAREGIGAGLTITLALLVLGVLLQLIFVSIGTYTPSLWAAACFALALLVLLYTLCSRKTVLVLGTPFARPMPLRLRVLELLGALSMAERFAFYLSLSPVSSSQSAEDLSRSIMKVCLAAAAAGNASPLAQPLPSAAPAVFSAAPAGMGGISSASSVKGRSKEPPSPTFMVTTR